jgi:hypothetical protein
VFATRSWSTTIAPETSVSPFSVAPGWSGPLVTNQTLHIVQYMVANGVATSFRGHGTAPLGLTSSSTVNLNTITMQPVATHHITGTVDVASSVALASITTAAVFADGTSASFNTQDTGTSFDHTLPGVIGTTGSMAVLGTRSTSEGTGIVASVLTDIALPSSGLTLALPDAPMALPIAPAANSTVLGVGTELEVTPAAGVAYYMQLTSFSGGGRVELVATSPRVVIPDTRPFGVTLEGEYRWSTAVVPGVSSADDLVAQDPIGIFSGRRSGLITQTPQRVLRTP